MSCLRMPLADVRRRVRRGCWTRIERDFQLLLKGATLDEFGIVR